MSSGTVQTRPYLRAGERRSQLLEAAAAVVGREGLGSLTVAGVAQEAGVSRQWVYEHFTDLDDLYRALIVDRFASLDATIETATRRLSGVDLVVFAGRRLFALVPADRRILRALLDGGGRNRPELVDIESELRERIFRRWTNLVRAAGHDEPGARAIIWAIVNAVFGFADQIDRDSLAVEEAVALLEVLVLAFTGTRSMERRSSRPSPDTNANHQQETGAHHAH